MDVVMIFNILEDEADEELLPLANHLRNENDEMFSQRSREEGCFSTLIQMRLIDNETRFREHSRVSFELFNYIIRAIKEDICRRPSNRIKKPISPEEKHNSLLTKLVTRLLKSQNYIAKTPFLEDFEHFTRSCSVEN
ncbi:Hypothetical protein CINCED_3A013162 [Cinara cedri]|uniref:Uncharacterized protein n=1 Tax=Cinara cedri TaxID=506608 RepID=A0A5E4NH18_9HEMI|nr:Hypothetical protein CINCED_3A013162 [Cinara cedri]